MHETNSGGFGAIHAGVRARKAVPTSPEQLVRFEPLSNDRALPLIARPAMPTVDLAWWAERHRELLEERLLRHGAIVFRGFQVPGVADFQRIVSACCSHVLTYKERSSPRTQVGEDVYTSTDHPPSEWIFPHNEHSYAKTFPWKLFFFCETPPAQGGETPLADMREVVRRIDPAIHRRLVERGYCYVRNLGSGLGLPWQTVYQTQDPAVVEQYCQAHAIEWEWTAADRLRTRQVRPVTLTHPRTGEQVWFNHLTFFHLSTLPSATRDALRDAVGEAGLPNHTAYADGAEIDDETVAHLRQAYLDSLVSFPWERGDLVMLDNLLTAHARAPFEGARRILFAMGDPITRTDLPGQRDEASNV